MIDDTGARQFKLPPKELRNRMAQVDRMLNIKPVGDNIVPKHIEQKGNYAVSITWSDGHSTSIYPYAELKQAAIDYEEEK